MAADDLWYSSYSFLQYLNTIFLVILNSLMASLILRQAYKILSCSSNISSDISSDSDKSGFWLYLLYLLTAILAVYETYGLATYGRYLSFPSEMAYIPVTGIVGLALIHCITQRQFSWHAIDLNRLVGNSIIHKIRDKMAGYALACIAIALIVGETRSFMLGRDFIIAYPNFSERLKMAFIFTLTNSQLLVWLLCLLVLAVSFLVAGGKNSILSQVKT